MPLAEPFDICIGILALPLMAAGLAKVLEQGGPKMRIAGLASNGEEARRMLRTGVPGVMLIDLCNSGDTHLIESLLDAGTARIVVLTRPGDLETQDRAVLAGARGVVTLSDSPETLVKGIQCVCAGEVWIDRHATSRIVMAVARQKAKMQSTPEMEKIATLTDRERQTICALMSAGGASSKKLAERLHISEHTLRNHFASIYSKLGVNNRVDLYAFAREHGLDGGAQAMAVAAA